MNLHEKHTKRCLKLGWETAERTTTDEEGVEWRHYGNVDLWHCDDCDVDYAHDWTDDSYEEVRR